MPRYKLTIEYDGIGYVGWQRQDGVASIQSALEDAVEKFCCAAVEVYGSGRTDAGVHALGQVAHIDLPKLYDDYNVMQGINFHLFPEHPRIAVVNAERVEDDFEARFSAARRHYRYRVLCRRARAALLLNRVWQVSESLDLGAMRQGAAHLIGHHDFTSFRDTQCQAKSPIKTLDHIELIQRGEEIMFKLHARSFLHHQVRIIVGTLWQVGTGRIHPDDVARILNAKDRTIAGPTAPACGLYLVKVEY